MAASREGSSSAGWPGAATEQHATRLAPTPNPHALLALSQAEGSQRGTSSAQGSQKAAPGKVVRRPEVVDDFLRNFFAKAGLSRTAEAFEAEWCVEWVCGRAWGGWGAGAPEAQPSGALVAA